MGNENGMEKREGNPIKLSSLIRSTTVIIVLLIIAFVPILAYQIGGLSLFILNSCFILIALHLLRSGILPPECDHNRTHRWVMGMFLSVVLLRLVSQTPIWTMIMMFCEYLGFSPPDSNIMTKWLDPVIVISMAFLLIHAFWIKNNKRMK